MKKFKYLSIIIIIMFILLLIPLSCSDDDCWVCFNGKCYKCNGKGYTKIDSNTCDVCRGSGICFNCQGTGKINKN